MVSSQTFLDGLLLSLSDGRIVLSIISPIVVIILHKDIIRCLFYKYKMVLGQKRETCFMARFKV